MHRHPPEGALVLPGNVLHQHVRRCPAVLARERRVPHLVPLRHPLREPVDQPRPSRRASSPSGAVPHPCRHTAPGSPVPQRQNRPHGGMTSIRPVLADTAGYRHPPSQEGRNRPCRSGGNGHGRTLASGFPVNGIHPPSIYIPEPVGSHDRKIRTSAAIKSQIARPPMASGESDPRDAK